MHQLFQINSPFLSHQMAVKLIFPTSPTLWHFCCTNSQYNSNCPSVTTTIQLDHSVILCLHRRVLCSVVLFCLFFWNAVFNFAVSDGNSHGQAAGPDGRGEIAREKMINSNNLHMQTRRQTFAIVFEKLGLLW